MESEPLTPEEQEVKQVASGFYAILGGEDAVEDPDRTTIDSAAFCELMSEQARAQAIRYARVSSGIAQDWDCETAVELLAIRGKRARGSEPAPRAKVIGVNAEGDRATATIDFGNGSVTSLPMVKEDGEWKLAAGSVPAAP